MQSSWVAKVLAPLAVMVVKKSVFAGQYLNACSGCHVLMWLL